MRDALARRLVLAALALGSAFAAPPFLLAQQRSAALPRIAIVQLAPSPPVDRRLDAFLSALRELGHVEGETILIDRWAATEGQSIEAIAYGPDRRYLHGRAAQYVDQILKGADPAEMPIERPTRFEFVVNLRTSQALAITLPPAIMLFATELTE